MTPFCALLHFISTVNFVLIPQHLVRLSNHSNAQTSPSHLAGRLQQCHAHSRRVILNYPFITRYAVECTASQAFQNAPEFFGHSSEVYDVTPAERLSLHHTTLFPFPLDRTSLSVWNPSGPESFGDDRAHSACHESDGRVVKER